SRSSAEVVPDDSHDRARMRTSSQFRSREDPPRGRTASATATVARPAIRPNRAAERRVVLFTPPAYRRSARLRQTPPCKVAEHRSVRCGLRLDGVGAPEPWVVR